MAKTIIQTIGPLYGEVINGTVFGRPNGSIYVPAQNTIKVAIPEDVRYIRVYGQSYVVCTSSGAWSTVNPIFHASVVAESQDLQNYIQFQVADSSDFSNVLGTISLNAGLFNTHTPQVAKGDSLTAIVQNDPYYIRAVLMSGSGVPVATSDSIEVAGVVVE